MSNKVIDLFCGCGGMSLGFQNAGFNIIAAYDNWTSAIEVYKKNFSHVVNQVDLSTTNITDELSKLSPDVIVGGPPCQDFSIAGKRNFNGERANLTLIFQAIISEVKPQWFVMENVYNIERSQIFNKVLGNFKLSGYGITKVILDASLTGVPQSRKRCFVIGKLGAEDNFILSKIQNGLSKTKMTVKEYMGDKLDTEFYYMHPRSYNRRAVFSVQEPSATIRGVNRPIPDNYSFHNADKCKDFSKIRCLTSKERSMIQTFPENFIFNGSKSSIEQLIGNAVPVKMAEYVANIIISEINEKH